MLRANDFKFSIDRVKDACRRVNTVDAMTFKQANTTDDIGSARWQEIVCGKCDVPNLKFTVTERDAAAFYDWFDVFVLQGHCTQADETAAELVFLDQSLTKELIRVTAHQVGIFKCTRDANADHAEKIQRCTIECYMEALTIDFLV